MPLWSFSVGHKGINRIRVYERFGTKSIYVEWFDADGRHQKALHKLVDHPVTDRKLAMKIATRFSVAQERRRNMAAEEAIFGKPHLVRSVDDVLSRLHEARATKWSAKHKQDQERYRKFWGSRVGPVPIPVSSGLIERVVAKATEENGWASGTAWHYKRYIVDALYFAQIKLKWIEERDNLSAVDLTKDSEGLPAYELGEANRVLDALKDVDPVAHAIGEVAFCTGRRITAIRNLPAPAYESPLLFFPKGRSNKSPKKSSVVLSRQAIEALDELRGAKWLFEVDGEPASYDYLLDKLEKAERACGVAKLPSRGWHGFKKVYATHTEALEGADLQAATRKETLRKHYRQDDLGVKEAVARHLEGIRG